MAKLRVALRADASSAIGLGHVKRCMSLALSLRKAGAQVRLVARELGIELANVIGPTGIEYCALPMPDRDELSTGSVPHSAWARVSWRRDAAETVEVLRDWQPHWVLVDHYSFDACWHRFVTRELAARIAAIDDLADRELDVELLVDHNLSRDHREKYRGRIRQATVVLGGPRYALLGPAYAAVPPFKVNAQVLSIGIFMGGVDSSDLSSIALRACRENLRFDGRIEIATTRAGAHGKQLAELAAKWPNTTLTYDQPDLVDFFARHDVQIGAGGGAVWERCCIGVPTLGLHAAANQRATLPALAELGAVAVLDPGAPIDESSIAQAVHSLIQDHERRKDLSTRSRALVDGLGAKRVALKLTAPSLSVRTATLADARMSYEWRNHSMTRQVSGNPQEIHWDDHLQWLQRTLDDTRRFLLVGQVGQTDIGLIRFDLGADGRSEISLYLDPALHGLGLGRALLLAGEKRVVVHHPGISGFIAMVLSGNEASRRMFESCGYVFQAGVGHKLLQHANE